MFAYTLFSFFAMHKGFFNLFTAYHSGSSYTSLKKERFCSFGSKLHCSQPFCTASRFSPVCSLSRCLSLYLTHKNVFCCCGATLRCVQLFRTGNGFCLFGANRAVLSCFGSLLPYFQLFCTWKRFSPVFFFWCLITLLSALSHGKDFSLSCRWI